MYNISKILKVMVSFINSDLLPKEWSFLLMGTGLLILKSYYASYTYNYYAFWPGDFIIDFM